MRCRSDGDNCAIWPGVFVARRVGCSGVRIEARKALGDESRREEKKTSDRMKEM